MTASVHHAWYEGYLLRFRRPSYVLCMQVVTMLFIVLVNILLMSL
jgi:hypothetical protein